MELTKELQRKLALKLQQSRLRLLESKPFYGLLLLYMKFSLDVAAVTAYTDGERIAFDPEFLNSLSDSEVDFVLMHEILHVALSHVIRGKDFEDHEAFNIATDIVVNSNILYSSGHDLNAISLSETGESMHNLPDGREGYDFSAEELYPIICKLKASKKQFVYGNLTSKRKQKGRSVPLKDANLTSDEKQGEPWDNHKKWDEKGGKDNSSSKGQRGGNGGNSQDASHKLSSDEMKDLWLKRMVDATELINSMAENMGQANARGTTPAFMERILKELKRSRLDWRTILQNFIQEDITDYSFSPPDRRFDGGDFFLPDFNEKEDSVKNILFMVDTSGSMGDEEILDAFSEVKGAVDQFNGKLAGWLGFFDAAVYEPIAFSDVDGLLKIKPKGGGGTDFNTIFNYVKEEMPEPPASIIIMTDGYAPFPDEEAAQGVPVLWLINNEEVTPKWGKIARITKDKAESSF